MFQQAMANKWEQMKRQKISIKKQKTQNGNFRTEKNNKRNKNLKGQTRQPLRYRRNNQCSGR